MSTTTPADLANTSWNGDIEATVVTNEMASEPGFPLQTEDGLVNVVKIVKDQQANPQYLADNGRTYSRNGTLLTEDGSKPTNATAEPASGPSAVAGQEPTSPNGYPSVEAPVDESGNTPEDLTENTSENTPQYPDAA